MLNRTILMGRITATPEFYRNKIIPDILTESRLQEHPVFRLLEKIT